MSSRFSLSEIRDYWTRQAKNNITRPEASWFDVPMMQLELAEMAKFVDDGDNVLDVGCANGYKTIELANKKNICIHGIDYVPDMIEAAKNQPKENTRSYVTFDVGNILDMHLLPTMYDKVVVYRVIINLHDWEQQIQGIQECAARLRPGGLLLMSEATVQGFVALNQVRKFFGVSVLEYPKYNNYLDVEKLITYPFKDLKFKKCVEFSSTYYFGTRVLRSVYEKLFRIKKSKQVNIFNHIFKKLSNVGKCGVQKLFIFEKIG